MAFILTIFLISSFSGNLIVFNFLQLAKALSKFTKEVVLIIFVKSIDSNFVQLSNVCSNFSILFIFLIGYIIFSKFIQEKNK